GVGDCQAGRLEITGVEAYELSTLTHGENGVSAVFQAIHQTGLLLSVHSIPAQALISADIQLAPQTVRHDQTVTYVHSKKSAGIERFYPNETTQPPIQPHDQTLLTAYVSLLTVHIDTI